MTAETDTARSLSVLSADGVRAGGVRRAARVSSAWWHIGVVLLFGGIAVLANLTAWTHGIGHTLQTSGGADVQEEVWFLAQTPWALLHGFNPLVNNVLNYPVGVDLMDNTSMPLLALMGWPITATLGPIATFNILVEVSFAASAIAAYFASLRFCRWRPAAVVAGAAYGFSPFFVAEGSAHLFLLFGVVPPLLLLVVDRYVICGEGSARWGGVFLGGCLVAQFYVSAEVFSSLVVMCITGAVVLGLAAWRRGVKVDSRRTLKILALAAAICVACMGYGAWIALTGPQHIVGPAQTRVALAGLSIDPLSLVVPTIYQHFTFGHAALGDSLVAGRTASWKVVFDAPLENGGYLGVPLIVLLVGGVVVLRKRRGVMFFAAVALVALVLALGTHLHVGGNRTAIPLPFDVLSHLPLLDSAVASRYMEFFWLCASVIVGIVLDAVFWRAMGSERARSAFATLVAAMVGCASLVLLWPAWPYGTSSASLPSWFSSEATTVPVGATVVVYPFASPVNSMAMVWQAEADDRFKMPGGYAVFATPTGSATFASQYTPLQSVLAMCAGSTPAHLPARTVRSQLVQWNTDAVVVVPGQPGAACAERVFGEALGSPRHTGQVLLWRTRGRVSPNHVRPGGSA